MKFSYNWLQSLIDKKLPKPNELSEILTMKLFEVEKVKKMDGDWIIDIDVLPSRAGDCFSHIGIAREISAILGLKFKEVKNKLKENRDAKIEKLVSVKVLNSNDCPRYMARVITGVKIGPSPKWIKEKLKVCGLQSINNVVDIANYIMLETGQPLHAFDMDKISGDLIVRMAEKGEKITTLDGKEYPLGNEVLVIADEEKLLGIAGIKGGESAGISTNTKKIIIESASFNRRVIRKGSAKLKIRSDASIRFEHGFDPNINKLAIDRVAYLIQKIAGGKIAKEVIDIYPKKNISKSIFLELKRVESILGVKIKKARIKKILETLGFKIKSEKGEILKIDIPTRRVDISLQEDLVEEIGRIVGYNTIPSKLSKMKVSPPGKNIGLFWGDKIKNIFKSSGFSEVYNYTFISERQSKDLNYSEAQLIEVESPVSIEQKYLRPSLIPHLFRNIKENEKLFSNIKIFELGKVFSKKLKKFNENKSLAGILTGDSFYQLKGVLEILFKEIGIRNINYFKCSDSEYPFLNLNKKACLSVGSINIGYLGVVSSNLRKKMKIDTQFSIFEINFDKIIEMASEEKQYIPIAKFPKMTRDIAIIVPFDLFFQEVYNKIKNCGPNLLKDIQLFDLYQGGGLPRDKKSFALRLTYQGDRTLTAEEVNQFQKKIIKEIEKEKKWQVRK